MDSNCGALQKPIDDQMNSKQPNGVVIAVFEIPSSAIMDSVGGLAEVVRRKSPEVAIHHVIHHGMSHVMFCF